MTLISNYDFMNKEIANVFKKEFFVIIFEGKKLKYKVNEMVWDDFFTFKERPNIHTVTIEYNKNQNQIEVDIEANNWEDDYKRHYTL